ncbi:MAG: tRNA (adenosine(37)-N6)-dimethylallyltransferase MiaA [Chlamydiales bacterium]|nr:tRNA (adenosine(37)-N6)-dimethylallyltransferase MiaA [Chlamydiales bacterium]
MTDLQVCEQAIFEEISFSCLLPLKKRDDHSQGVGKKKVILIAGPTGSGKTELSLILAECLNKCEIISTDSMQVYRGMDIGTAKPSLLEQASVPHHLIDIRHITETFNVVDFYYEAQECIKAILSRGNIPILVGGAGFYFRALLYGPPSGPPSIPQVRCALEHELKTKGVDALFERLAKLDPTYTATITRGDKHKIIRALEIITLTREQVSSFSWKERAPPSNYDYRCWFVFRPRDVLYKRIEDRCEKMLESGLLEEVKGLIHEGLKQNLSACQAIGYKQCLDFLDTAQTEEEYKKFVAAFKQASRRYAKKQFTWFKKEESFRWLNIDLHDFETAAEIIIRDYLK